MARVSGVFQPAVLASSTTVVSPAITAVAGNMLVVFVTYNDTSSGTINATVSDSLGNSYVAGTKARNPNNSSAQMFYALNVSAGSTVVTATFNTAAAYRTLIVEQYDSISASGAFESETAPTTGSGTLPVTGLFNTVSASTLVVAMASSLQPTAVNSPYTLRQSGNYAASIDTSFSSAQTSITAGVTAPTGPWSMHAMVFKTTATPTPTPTPTSTIARDDPALAYSPYSWNDNGSNIAADAPGAYVRFNFTGTSLAMTIAALSGLSNYPAFRAYIDNLPAIDATPTSGQTNITFASGLAAGTHTCTIVLKAQPVETRWDRSSTLKIVNLLIDTSATVSAPTLRTKRMLSFGDSITEGYRVLSANDIPAGSDATLSIVPLIAEALGAEYGQIGYGGQGFTKVGDAGVPTFNNAYSLHTSGSSRLSGGLFSPAPDYITCMHGTNGTPAQSDVATAITNLRAAAPSAWIFMIVPPGGFRRTAITAATNAAITAGDTKLALIDAGSGSYQIGLEGTPPGTAAYGPVTATSVDTIHPNQRANARHGSEVVRQLQHVLEPRRFTVVGI